MASKKDFKVVKSFFAAWVERDGKVSFVNDGVRAATWKNKSAAEKNASKHWARPTVFMVKGEYLK